VGPGRSRKKWQFIAFPGQGQAGRVSYRSGGRRKPCRPITPQADAIKGSYTSTRRSSGQRRQSINFGGIWGGQLQRWASGAHKAEDVYPAKDQPALSAKVARLGDDMMTLPKRRRTWSCSMRRKALTAGDNGRRFFEASWLHSYCDAFGFSHSTGDTHFIMQRPAHRRMVRSRGGEDSGTRAGLTNHHSIVEFKGKWYSSITTPRPRTVRRICATSRLRSSAPRGRSIVTVDAYLN
jgi:hypothetical protein